MIVTPAAGRQRFQFQVRVHMGQVAPPAPNMSAIVKDRQPRLVLMNGLVRAAGVVRVGLLAQGLHRRRVTRVLSDVEQRLQAGVADAGPNTNDVEEDTVGVVIPNHLLDLRDQNIQVRCVQAELVVSGLQECVCPVHPVIGVADQPLGMPPRFLLIQPRGKVNRRLDTDIVRGLDLCP